MPITLPALDRTALLLDLDGTLVDLAPTPESVVAPPELLATLRALRPMLGDALAIISGRPVEQVEALLPDVPYAIVGEHGGAVRPGPGMAIARPNLPAVPVPWLDAADRIALAEPGTRVERKARGFVLHYRAVPASGPRLRTALQPIVTDPRFEILPASMAWEVRPRGVDKGTAVRLLMQAAPFDGRLPLFIGDDVTDWDAIRTANAMGGTGLLVEEHFAGPGDVRGWLQRAALTGAWVPLVEWRRSSANRLEL